MVRSSAVIGAGVPRFARRERPQASRCGLRRPTNEWLMLRLFASCRETVLHCVRSPPD
jgi:hypothetical protein